MVRIAIRFPFDERFRAAIGVADGQLVHRYLIDAVHQLSPVHFRSNTLKTTPADNEQFDFGENWSAFSKEALSKDRVDQARRDFGLLLGNLTIEGKFFLDIGFGQGLSLLIAAESQANVTGCDINPKCADVLSANRRFFAGLRRGPNVVVGSILDQHVVLQLSALGNAGGKYDFVHSWGVLHHTGNMHQAILNAGSLVAPGGYLILAIYNRHWSSRSWLFIKFLYVKSPGWFRRLLVAAFYPVIYIAKWLTTKGDPKKQERGMDFYYNVIDWVGGYPYEYASKDEILSRLAAMGFRPIKVVPSIVPTGCNEFVFQRGANP